MERQFFLSLLVLIGQCFAIEDFTWTKRTTDYESNERQLVGHLLKEYPNTHLVTQCAFHCQNEEKCLSFNYDSMTKLCQLSTSNDVHHRDSLAVTTQFDYFRKGTFQISEDALGPCATSPCENDGQCLDVVTADGVSKYLCVCQGIWTGTNCTTKGGKLDWSAWSDWSECSTTCGQGWKRRQRACIDINTQQEHTAFDCFGKEIDIEACQLDPCPYWSVWSEWSECSTSTTCGRGLKSRERQCLNNGVPGHDRLCMGASNETSPCESPGCTQAVRLVHGTTYGEGIVEVYDDYLGSWGRVCSTSWGIEDADVVCKQLGFHGGAALASTEGLTNVQPGPYFLTEMTCTEKDKSLQACVHSIWSKGPPVSCDQTYASVQCIVDGGWSNWSDWSDCSVSCEMGHTTRSRTCDYPAPAHGGKTCSGEPVERQDCLRDPCPVDGQWKAWNVWSECSVACGGGTRNRDRECQLPQNGGDTCTGQANQEEECNTEPCPVDGFWKAWSQWTTCDKQCGGGSQSRSRECVEAQHGGADCIGDSQQKQQCNTGACPVDCTWNLWSDWGPCDVSCGSGGQTRMRTKNEPEHSGVPCEGPDSEWQACHPVECPIDCVWNEWEVWQQCSVSCGEGTQQRTRSKQVVAEHGGVECEGSNQEQQSCNDGACPVDGEWDPWSDWGACSLTCGDGERTRTRKCNLGAHGGKNCTGESSETEACYEKDCAIHGKWEEWEAWSPCSASCNNGTQTRSRTCVGPFNGGDPCVGDSQETQHCFIIDCPVDGYWESWGEWSDCSVTCGDGVFTRSRICVEPIGDGAPCMGDSTNEKPCSIECNKPGEWQEWSTWSICSVTCGPGGLRLRQRSCNMTTHGENTAMCIGDSQEQKTCHDYDCLPLAANCEEWRQRGMEDSVDAYIKPDEDNEFSVRCNMTAIPGTGVTEVKNNAMQETLVHGFEASGEYQLTVEYEATMPNIMALMAGSTSCRQFIRWQCVSATITNPHDDTIINTFWTNRDGVDKYYWGGVPETGVGCACGLDDSCDKPNIRCNCDANDKTKRSDFGFLSYMPDLPVSVFKAGDTGGEDEFGYSTLGPLQCY